MSATIPEHCKFFVQRKKRYCKMLVKQGQEFCGEHQKPSDMNTQQNNSDHIRILCPLDATHTVYTHNLKKHLKICNARDLEMRPFITKDINSGVAEVSPELQKTLNSHQMLSSFPKEQIQLVIDKVNNIYNKYVKISDKILSCSIVEKEMEKPEYGNKTKKHLKQSSAILGLLEEYKMIKENTCYVEFGAGRGQLSCWIAQATEMLNNTKILLVERASPKHKRDNKLAKVTNRIQRIRADIADLVLDKVDAFKDVCSVIGVTKHLCGDATDLTIRCMTSSQATTTKVSGAVLTFCCHHRCRWTAYTGKKFFEESGLSVGDFNVMCGLSSWATCGSGFSREYREKLKDVGQQDNEEKDAEYDLSRTEREAVGRKCKNIINWGRLKYLNQFNFQCLLHHYVGKDITLENVCIIALK